MQVETKETRVAAEKIAEEVILAESGLNKNHHSQPRFAGDLIFYA
jgi:hypothetical protein